MHSKLYMKISLSKVNRVRKKVAAAEKKNCSFTFWLFLLADLFGCFSLIILSVACLIASLFLLTIYFTQVKTDGINQSVAKPRSEHFLCCYIVCIHMLILCLF